MVGQGGARILSVCSPQITLDTGEGPQWPLVIFTFDEPHALTEHVFQLRRILQEIVTGTSYFLPTAGSFKL